MSKRFRLSPLIFALFACVLLMGARDASALPQVQALWNIPTSAAGIAVDPDTDRVFVSNRPANEIRVYSKYGTLVHTISAPINFFSTLDLDPVNNRLYVGGLRAFDTETYELVAEATPPPGSSGWMAYNPANGRVYTAEFGNDVRIFDGATLAFLQEIDLGTGFAAGIAVDPVRNRIFAASTQGVFAIDGTTHAVTLLYTAPPNSQPAAIAVSPTTGRIFAAYDDSPNTLVRVIDDADGSVIDTIVLAGAIYADGSEGIGIDPVTDVVYVNDDAYITRFDGGTLDLIDRIKPHPQWSIAMGFAFNSPDQKVFVPDTSQFLVTLAEAPVGGEVDLGIVRSSDSAGLGGRLVAVGALVTLLALCAVRLRGSRDFSS